ncbi:MAG: dehypoxanthine futalosine cyclase [Nitrospirae bacterium]|nr:dehypoxanthine futalosine cyclase [Nitrospirota bacterium]
MKRLIKKIYAGKRLTREEGLALFRGAKLLELGRAADSVRKRLHPEGVVTFVVDRNINYTNVCVNQCKFCAFYRTEDDAEAYLLPDEEVFAKVEETLEAGGTQILIQGGLHPALDIAYYERLFTGLKARYPINIHGLSPAEVKHIAKMSKLTVREALTRLKDAGLDSIPGGGAEILVDSVRGAVSPKKITYEGWREVMLLAQEMGMPTTATMMFGSVETDEDIVEHLARLREMQDVHGGFTAFIPWTYQPGNTELGGRTATGVEYLRVLAFSRVFLDNFPSVQASWVTQGAALAQVSLRFGANDFGSTMLEENVVAATGIRNRMSMEDIIYLIRDAGFTPAQRDTKYMILKTF